MGTTRKLAAIGTAAALALSLPAGSLAHHRGSHSNRSCPPQASNGKKHQRGHAHARENRGHGKKCGHRR